MKVLQGLTVLVVEDETQLLNLYEQWLGKAGAEVLPAENGVEAMDMIDDSVDVALLDRRMPQMSGDALLDEIRANGNQIPVGMVTAVDPDYDVIEMGFDDYVVKPIEKNELIQTVEDLVQRTRIRPAVRQFVRVGAKLHHLQENQRMDQLKMRDDYQDLYLEFKSLSSDLSSVVDDLTDYEKKFLYLAKEKAKESTPLNAAPGTD